MKKRKIALICVVAIVPLLLIAAFLLLVLPYINAASSMPEGATLSLTDLGDGSFELSWPSGENAGSYRVRITAMIEGKETDVTNAIPSLTVIFDAESIRELAEGEAAQLLLVPNDGEPEAQVSTVQYVEETDTEPARYEALLTESGLFVMTLQ